MNETSAPFARGDNEFALAGLTMAECRLVAAPRVAESPAALECKVVDVVEIRSASGAWSGAVLTLGEVVAFHIDDDFLLDGRFDTARAHPSPCGYQDTSRAHRSPDAATRTTPRSRKSSPWLGRRAAATFASNAQDV